MLSLVDVDKTYAGRSGPVVALRGIGLSLAVGRFAVISGPSGSGKTTLLHVAAGLLRADAGRVEFAGRDLATLGEGARASLRRQSIGVVFQRAHLLPYLDILANTCIGGGDQVAVRAALAEVGLANRLAHRPGELSAGERQRAALVRALAHRPRLLLADEPTANLDPDSARIVIAQLRTAATGGAAVLVASHDAQVQTAADERWRMATGNLCKEHA